MKISHIILTIFIFGAAVCHCQTPPHYSGISDGNSLKAFCKDISASPTLVDSFNYGMCAGYISGVVGAESQTQYFLKAANVPDKREIRFCIDLKIVQYGQLVAIVNKFLEDHPNHLEQAAAGFVSDAFSRSFPCKDSQPVSQ
jgi:hypothetical protein